jgi:hypothetical protein
VRVVSLGPYMPRTRCGEVVRTGGRGFWYRTRTSRSVLLQAWEGTGQLGSPAMTVMECVRLAPVRHDRMERVAEWGVVGG